MLHIKLARRSTSHTTTQLLSNDWVILSVECYKSCPALNEVKKTPNIPTCQWDSHIHLAALRYRPPFVVELEANTLFLYDYITCNSMKLLQLLIPSNMTTGQLGIFSKWKRQNNLGIPSNYIQWKKRQNNVSEISSILI